MSKFHELSNGSSDTMQANPMFELLAESEEKTSFKRGDVITGTVAMNTSNEILIDVGGKFEGLLSPREYSQMSREERAMHLVGNPVEVYVVSPSDKSGNLLLSIKQVHLGQDWEDAKDRFDRGESFESSIDGHNKGGLIVYVGSVRGFVPISQIDRRHAIDRSLVDGSDNSPLSQLVGETLWMKVMEIDRDKNRLILSEQAAMRERRKLMKTQLLDDLSEGQVVEGKVTSLADFGAFVDIGGADGLVHLSEISWNRVDNPREVLKLGQKLEVKIISIDRERNRIGLSLKQLQPEPWETIDKHFMVGDIVEGTITRLVDFGAFARLEGDLIGLIHVSELSDDDLPPEQLVSVGLKLPLRIIRIDTDRKRIGLSLKRAHDDYDQLGAIDTSASDSENDASDDAAPAEDAEISASDLEEVAAEVGEGTELAEADTESAEVAAEDSPEPAAEDES